MIQVTRLGYPRSDRRDQALLQETLTSILTAMEYHGHQILSASVLADPTKDERYEVYVVSRVARDKGDDIKGADTPT